MTTYFLEDHGGKVSDARVVVKGHRRQLQLADIVANAQLRGELLSQRGGAWAPLADLSHYDTEPVVIAALSGSQRSARKPPKRFKSMSTFVGRAQLPAGIQQGLEIPGLKLGYASLWNDFRRASMWVF